MAPSRNSLTATACLLLLAQHSAPALAATNLVESTSKDNSDDCDCYTVDGPVPGYFQYHRFWDFRDVAADGSNDYTKAPDVVGTEDDAGGQKATSSFLKSKDWTRDWTMVNGHSQSARDVEPLKNVFSQQNVFLARNSSKDPETATYLNLRSVRLPNFMSNAQLTSNQANLLHASIRARMRILPNNLDNSAAPKAAGYGSSSAKRSTSTLDKGGCVGIFTYMNATQETDVEMLSKESTGRAHLASQPDWDYTSNVAIPGASTKLNFPNGGVSTEWHDYRIDWFDGVVYWYLDGHLWLKKTINAPTAPSALMINVWGDGGNWTGNMTEGGQLNAGIQYIEVAFNTSGPVTGDNQPIKRAASTCKSSCQLDGVKHVGYPQTGAQIKSGTDSSGGSSSSGTSSSGSSADGKSSATQSAASGLLKGGSALTYVAAVAAAFVIGSL